MTGTYRPLTLHQCFFTFFLSNYCTFSPIIARSLQLLYLLFPPPKTEGGSVGAEDDRTGQRAGRRMFPQRPSLRLQKGAEAGYHRDGVRTPAARAPTPRGKGPPDNVQLHRAPGERVGADSGRCGLASHPGDRGLPSSHEDGQR